MNKSLVHIFILYDEKHCQKCSRFGTRRLAHICFVQIGENDAKTDKDDPLGLNTYELVHALINIVE